MIESEKRGVVELKMSGETEAGSAEEQLARDSRTRWRQGHLPGRLIASLLLDEYVAFCHALKNLGVWGEAPDLTKFKS
jgi:hypothetical protein